MYLWTHTSKVYVDIVNTYLENINYEHIPEHIRWKHILVKTYDENIPWKQKIRTHTWTHNLKTYKYENISRQHTFEKNVTKTHSCLKSYLWNHTRVLREAERIPWKYMVCFQGIISGMYSSDFEGVCFQICVQIFRFTDVALYVTPYVKML